MPPWSELGIQHLQLSPVITGALRTAGINSLEQASRLLDGSGSAHVPYRSELVEAILQLQMASAGPAIDWRQYWLLRNDEYHQLAAILPEFDKLADLVGDWPVDRETLGNPGAMLRQSGIANFADLISGLRLGLEPVRGIGRTKLTDLFQRLLALADKATSGDLPATQASTKAEVAKSFSAAVRQLPMGILQLGSKGQLLADAGFNTIADVVDADLRSINRRWAVGSRTVDLIKQRLSALAEASKDSDVDWRRFAGLSGFVLLPAEAVTSGSEFIASLPQVLEGLTPHLRDDGYRNILTYRLTKAPREQRTLDEIAHGSKPPVTRERIRQKEQKLLAQLTGALIGDRGDKLGVQFHPTFTSWWRRAAAEFEGVEEIGFEEFVHRLARCWEVSVLDLSEHLPFITAVVTGEPHMPIAFREGVKLDRRLNALAPAAAATSVLKLRLGRAAYRVRDRGILTLGDLVRAAFEGMLSSKVVAALELLATAIKSDGTIDWQIYANKALLISVPAVPPADAATFIESFPDTICAILTHFRSGNRAAQIFALRTQHPARRRMTLEAVAAEIGTHQPTIKRLETNYLEQLHEIIVDREFAELKFWLDQAWLELTSDAYEVYQSTEPDYERFSRNLALSWAVSVSFVERASAGLWAIFTGYPEGRYRRSRSADIDPDDILEPPSRIRLRGFRLVH